MGVPVVSHQVGVMACADLLRPLVDGYSANPPMDELTRLANENPELLGAVKWLAEGDNNVDLLSAFAAAALVVKVLRAQAEVDALQEMVRP